MTAILFILGIPVCLFCAPAIVYYILGAIRENM